ncbi:MAG: D-aminoacylase [Saprospiraceae bacterium]|nr:D-aminoacylase [Saprospiraceae bacterium]
MKNLIFSLIISLSCFACKSPIMEVDGLITNAMIYDGSGDQPVLGSLYWNADTIVTVGSANVVKAKTIIDAGGMALAPGFVNMLSWAPETLIYDGRSMSDLTQGVTLEIFGEGNSMGPINPTMKKAMQSSMGEHRYKIKWTTLGGYLEFLEKRGVSCNFGSFIGAATPRINILGYANRQATAEELKKMKDLVAQSMQEGAMGVASALIYAPGTYANTQELIEMSKVASAYGGIYISHIRSEGNNIWTALDEVFTIAKQANIPAEIYHLKISGKENWQYQDRLEQKIDSARQAGLKITADMYNYTAGATGLDAAMPTWCQEGGYMAWAERLKDSVHRKRILNEMETETNAGWENFYKLCGPENMLTVEYQNKGLRKYIGKTIAEIARERGTTPAETILDLVIEDGTRVGVIYFMMSEENVKRNIKLPYVSFCSDAGSIAAEGMFLENNVHPRAYGSFARLLGKYVREEKVIPLEEAIRKLTSLPCENLGIKKRGRLRAGYFADLVIFDPATIKDHATFEKPHQYSQGVIHVVVNGIQVIKAGQHTGAKPGRAVRGPGWKGK